jgi:hypothetical protein
VDPVTILDHQGDGAAEGLSEPETGENSGLVRLDPHPATAPVASHAALQLMIDVGGVEGKAGGDSIHDRQ